MTESVLALGRGKAMRLGEGQGAERGTKMVELGERGGDGNGTEGGGPLVAFVAPGFFRPERFGATGKSLKLRTE